MIILGIDPGSTRAGYGIIDFHRTTPAFIDAGIVLTSASDKNKMLLELYEGIHNLINIHKPSAAGMEKLFFMKNMKTATEVAQSRGVMILSICQHGIPLHEFTPSEIKSGIAGYGSADKKLVTEYVRRTLRLDTNTQLLDDAFDALAVAIVTGFYITRLGNAGGSFT